MDLQDFKLEIPTIHLPCEVIEFFSLHFFPYCTDVNIYQVIPTLLFISSLSTQPIWETYELIAEGQDLGEGQFIPRSSEGHLKQKLFAIQQLSLCTD